MSKLGLFLDAASLITEMSMASQLESMRQQGSTTELIQQFTKALRNRIFYFNDTAKTILATENENIKTTAGLIRLLENQLRKSGITPDLFNEISDKEYAAETVRLIRDNSMRLVSQLTQLDKDDVDNFVSETKKIPDYNYYIDNHEKLKKYNENFPASTGPGGGTRILGCLAFIFGILGTLATCFWGFFLLPMAGGLGGSGEGEAILGLGMLLIIFVPLLLFALPFVIFGFVLYRKGNKGVIANKNIQEILSAVNIEELIRLDQEFNGDVNQVKINLEHAEIVSQKFLGRSLTT